jgi:hypothetical protein
MILLGPFAPDKASLDSGVSIKALNVYATGRGFGPMPSFSSYGVAALPSRCLGLFFARTNSGSWLAFAGTKTKLYKLVSGAWSDYSGAVTFNVPDGDYWSATQFGSYLIVTNTTDGLYSIDVDTAATAFSAHPAVPTPPKARVVRALGGYLFLLGIATTPKRLKWSADGDSLDFDLDPSGTGASERDFPTGGRLLSMHGSETGFIIQEQAVRRFAQIPAGDFLFDIDLVEGVKGGLGPYSSVSFGQSVFALLQDGFYELGPQGINPIGQEWVNEWFFDTCDGARLEEVIATVDPFKPHIIWQFYSTSGITYFDRQLIYNWQKQQWTYANVQAQMMGPIAAPGTTLEQLDSISGSIDGLSASLDARQWEGDNPSLASINSAGVLCFANGPNLEAVIEGDDTEVNPGGRATLSELEVATDATGHTLRIAYRSNSLHGAIEHTSSLSNTRGRFFPRLSARTMRPEVTIPAGEVWTYIKGVRPSLRPDGRQ